MARTADMPQTDGASAQSAKGAHGDALSALAYGAMSAQTAITTASTHQTVVNGARTMVARGREIESGTRERKTTRTGKVTDKVALKAASAAATPAADVARTLSATNLGMTATRAASIAAKFALPVMMGKALFDAGRGFQRDGLKGAILGAGDSVAFGRATAALTGWERGGAGGAVDGLTFGLMSWAAKHVPESLRGARHADQAPASSSPASNNDARNSTGAPNRLDRQEAQHFQRADATRQSAPSRSPQPTPDKAPSGGLIGFQNPGTIQAALAAQGKTLKNEPVVRTA